MIQWGLAVEGKDLVDGGRLKFQEMGNRLRALRRNGKTFLEVGCG